MNLRAICILLALSGATHAYIVDGSRVHKPHLLSFAKEHLPNQGVVQQHKNGAAYVKVPDQYIFDLIRQVSAEGFEVPTQGAIIDIIEVDEAKQFKELAELGAIVNFEPIAFYTIVEDDQEFFMLAVAAPALATIRQKYGLSEKLANHEFKLTIGVRKLEAHNELGN